MNIPGMFQSDCYRKVEPKRLKKCRSCEKLKPVAEFSKKRASRDGLNPYCASCDSKRQARTYQRRKSLAA